LDALCAASLHNFRFFSILLGSHTRATRVVSMNHETD
jgi:hypothetical protein